MNKDYLNLKNVIEFDITAVYTNTNVYHKLNRLPEFVIQLSNEGHYGILSIEDKDNEKIVVKANTVGAYKIFIM